MNCLGLYITSIHVGMDSGYQSVRRQVLVQRHMDRKKGEQVLLLKIDMLVNSVLKDQSSARYRVIAEQLMKM